MGILTSDMIRVCGEINALRDAREALLKELVNGVKQMQAGFRHAHAEMATKTKAGRVAFVSSLKKTVSGLRKEFATDIAGARRAWSGKRA
jgi:hypothetical protein